jgi:hypothetical protein
MTRKKSFFYCGKRLLSVKKPAELLFNFFGKKMGKTLSFYGTGQEKHKYPHKQIAFWCHLEQE